MVRVGNQFFNMKTKIQTIFTVLALVGTINAQSINVTPTGVGIGTATPTQKLDVAGNINAAGNIVAAGDITAGGKLTSTGDITTAGKITTSGNVGIGTVTPGMKLEVANNGAKPKGSGRALLFRGNAEGDKPEGVRGKPKGSGRVLLIE